MTGTADSDFTLICPATCDGSVSVCLLSMLLCGFEASRIS